MTQEQKRFKIAQAVGLNPVDVPFKGGQAGRWLTAEAARVHHRNWPRGATMKVIPDYFNDLNAMHEAEKSLGDTFHAYSHLLHRMAARENMHPCYGAVAATAAQRAEAFGQTLKLWEAEQ